MSDENIKEFSLHSQLCSIFTYTKSKSHYTNQQMAYFRRLFGRGVLKSRIRGELIVLKSTINHILNSQNNLKNWGQLSIHNLLAKNEIKNHQQNKIKVLVKLPAYPLTIGRIMSWSVKETRYKRLSQEYSEIYVSKRIKSNTSVQKSFKHIVVSRHI